MDQPQNNDDKILTFTALYYKYKGRLLTFLGDTAFNIHSIEGGVLGIMVHIYPTHAIALVNFFIVYLFYKPTTPP